MAQNYRPTARTQCCVPLSCCSMWERKMGAPRAACPTGATCVRAAACHVHAATALRNANGAILEPVSCWAFKEQIRRAGGDVRYSYEAQAPRALRVGVQTRRTVLPSARSTFPRLCSSSLLVFFGPMLQSYARVLAVHFATPVCPAIPCVTPRQSALSLKALFLCPLCPAIVSLSRSSLLVFFGPML